MKWCVKTRSQILKVIFQNLPNRSVTCRLANRRSTHPPSRADNIRWLHGSHCPGSFQSVGENVKKRLMNTRYFNVETKTTRKQQKKISEELRWNKLVTGISWAVSSDSRAYAIGIHSSGIKIDSSNNSQSWVEEQPSKRAWNSPTLVIKAMMFKKWIKVFSKRANSDKCSP